MFSFLLSQIWVIEKMAMTSCIIIQYFTMRKMHYPNQTDGSFTYTLNNGRDEKCCKMDVNIIDSVDERLPLTR